MVKMLIKGKTKQNDKRNNYENIKRKNRKTISEKKLLLNFILLYTGLKLLISTKFEEVNIFRKKIFFYYLLI